MKNNTSRIADFSQLVENLKETGNKKNVAVVWAEDSHTLEAVEMAYEAGFANPSRQQKNTKASTKFFWQTIRRTLPRKQWHLCEKDVPMR